MRNKVPFILLLLLSAALAVACVQSAPGSMAWNPGGPQTPTAVVSTPTRTPWLPATRAPGVPIHTPTPDPPRQLPTPRTIPDHYTVQIGDTLGQIAQRYGVTINDIVKASQLVDPNILSVGQELVIPAATPQGPAIDFKIIPDSELVNGPVSTTLDVADFVQKKGGFLASYQEGNIDGRTLTGAQIIIKVSTEYSVSPRILLAALEYQSGWVTQVNPSAYAQNYPMGLVDNNRKLLFRQMVWAAMTLNRGYYLWKINAIPSWQLADGTVLTISPTLNAGTAAVQYLFSLTQGQAGWMKACTDGGVSQTFTTLFGYPFDLAVEPLIPKNLTQPPMQLPFEPGNVWSFTSGPHPGWAEGSAWAALDFAPPGNALGCVQSNVWVVAVADGLIVRSDLGAVVQDLDGDGYEQTGWTVLYMHIESRDRIQAGAFLKAGERIGHPSCEGGVSNGTHLHLARRYNGEWIAADGPIPFNLDGWISSGDGIEYNGYLNRNGQTVEAWDKRRPENQISR